MTGDGMAEVLSEVRRLREDVAELRGDVKRLDYALRGNGVEGLNTKVARLDTSHGEHGRRLDSHESRVAAVERRVFLYAGVGAGIGGLGTIMLQALIQKVWA